MVKYQVNIRCILLIIIVSQHITAQKAVCGFNEILDRQSKTDTSLIQRFVKTNQVLTEAVRNNENIISTRNEIIIPTVIHIVWSRPEENINDLIVLEQIDILNHDFNSENKDLANVPIEFQSLIAQTGIRFCLASKDPRGMPTSGIVRVKTKEEAIGTKDNLFFSDLGGSDAWDTKSYLNIWIANTGEFLTGFGTFPDQVKAEKQGVVVHPKYFGKNTSSRYNLGRVTVHEVGHYLGLNHLWDNNSNCDTDDGVPDTPFQQLGYTGCPTHPQTSCGSIDMYMNFMDYVDDDCMVMFTQGQMERMIATLNIYRPKLIDSQVGCIQHSVNKIDSDFLMYPNPTRRQITISFQNPIAKNGTLYVYNTIGHLVYEYNGIFINKTTINLPQLIPGIYWVQIGSKGKKLAVI